MAKKECRETRAKIRLMIAGDTVEGAERVIAHVEGCAGCRSSIEEIISRNAGDTKYGTSLAETLARAKKNEGTIAREEEKRDRWW